MTGDNCRNNADQERQRAEECLAEARYLIEGGFSTTLLSRAPTTRPFMLRRAF